MFTLDCFQTPSHIPSGQLHSSPGSAFSRTLGDLLLALLEQWFSTVLMLRPFHTVPHVVVTPQPENYPCGCFIAVNSLLLCIIVDISYVGYLICDPCEKVVLPQKGSWSTENHYFIEFSCRI